MKKIAIILAGGIGNRTGQDIPKQFLNVNDKPIIIYTLEAFQKNPTIDEIEVVCKEGWHDILEAYANQFNINKLKYVITGGATAQESIKLGLFNLEKVLKKDDIVVIHDGVRPMVDEEVLSDVVAVCEKYGNAVTSLPYNEQIFVVNEDDQSTTNKYVPRDTLRRVSTPQAYKFGEIDDAYHYAFENNFGIGNSTYANTLMVDLGKTLHFASGSDKNIKITTRDDIEIFKAYVKSDKDDWLK